MLLSTELEEAFSSLPVCSALSGLGSKGYLNHVVFNVASGVCRLHVQLCAGGKRLPLNPSHLLVELGGRHCVCVVHSGCMPGSSKELTY